MRITDQTSPAQPTFRVLLAAASLLAATGLSGCLAVGYSSSGGWFLWPPVGLIVLVLLVIFLLRRR